MKHCASILIALTLIGCASKPQPQPEPERERIRERVILLPSAGGKQTGVVVTTRNGEVELSTPYTVVQVGRNSTQATTTTEEEVKSRYEQILAAQPKEPRAITLFFVLGSDELTSESKVAFELARREIASWEGADMVVIGHTDRIGREEANDALSRKRASTVATRLIHSGVPADRIVVAGRGEHEPLIPTKDEVSEPRNRRVEIKIR